MNKKSFSISNEIFDLEPVSADREMARLLRTSNDTGKDNESEISITNIYRLIVMMHL